MKGTETIYGMHAVRVMLERHPERVHSVRIAEQRDDPRVRAIDELARRHQRPVQRVEVRALKQLLGDVAHQGVAADITPLPPWSEDALLAALQSASAPLLLALGAEGTGLRRLTRQNCDFLVRLAELGAVESLNVSVAAGMLLYEAVRQRQAR